MAENDMMHLDYIARVRCKYSYSSNDEGSKYESDNDKRDLKINVDRMEEAEELRKDLKCDVCQFTT